MKNYSLNINGLTVGFSTNFEKYNEYFSAYFDQIISKDDHIHHDILITFDHCEGSLNNKLNSIVGEKRFSKIGANTYVGEKHVVTIRKIERRWKLLFDISLNDDKLDVHIYLSKKPLKDFFRYGPLGKNQHEWFFSATYYLLYYPLFWYLAYRKQMFPLHASAFQFNGRGVVICGLEGIGKTSLGLKFLNEEGGRFLSDNLILCDNIHAHPCYELIRIHADEEEGLWKDNFEKINSFNILKNFFRPKFELKTEGIKVDLILFPEFSDKFSLTELSKEEAAQRAEALSYLPSELNHYMEYRILFDLLQPGRNIHQNQLDAYSSMLGAAKCLRVGMKKEDGLDENFKRLKDSI